MRVMIGTTTFVDYKRTRGSCNPQHKPWLHVKTNYDPSNPSVGTTKNHVVKDAEELTPLYKAVKARKKILEEKQNFAISENVQLEMDLKRVDHEKTAEYALHHGAISPRLAGLSHVAETSIKSIKKNKGAITLYQKEIESIDKFLQVVREHRKGKYFLGVEDEINQSR